MKRRIVEETQTSPKIPQIYGIITSRTKNTQSHGTGNYTCNSRTASRNGKTVEEEEELTIFVWLVNNWWQLAIIPFRYNGKPVFQ